jgi:ketosteroid isomerase-like protein
MRRAPTFATAEAAEEAFYDALQKGDLGGMMSLWADDDDAVCIHPNGPRLVGLPAIRSAWSQILNGGGMDIRATGVHVFQGAMVAIHNVIEKMIVKRGGRVSVVECAATNVYLKGADGWRMVLHQAGGINGDERPVAAGNDTLH